MTEDTQNLTSFRARLNAAPASAGSRPRRSDSLRLSGPVLNLVLDAALMFTFAVLVVVSCLLQFVFPPGIAARGWVLWRMDHSQWCGLQFAVLCVLTLGIVVHVMLHWNWVCGVIVRQVLKGHTLPDDGVRTLFGVGLLITVLLFGAIVTGAAIVSIEMPDSPVRTG